MSRATLPASSPRAAGLARTHALNQAFHVGRIVLLRRPSIERSSFTAARTSMKTRASRAPRVIMANVFRWVPAIRVTRVGMIHALLTSLAGVAKRILTRQQTSASASARQGFYL